MPTDKAYRYFVNNIIQNYELVPKARDKVKIESAISKSGNNPGEMNKNIARMLSELSDNLVITKVDESDNFVKVGLSSLFNLPEFREIDRAFRLTNFFDGFVPYINRTKECFILKKAGVIGYLIGPR